MAKLLVIVSYKVFPPQMGGQKGIVFFYDHLRKYHDLVMAVSRDNGTPQTEYGIESFLFNNHRIGLNVFQIRRLIGLIKKEGVDVIIAEHSYTGWLAWILKQWTGKPFIIHSHNLEASRFRQMGKRGWKLFHHYEKWIHQKADFSFFKTEEEKKMALHDFALSEKVCAVIPYGVPIIQKNPGAAQRVRQQFNLSTEFLFYFNGTLDYLPNRLAVETIIESIDPLLQESGIDYTILISGKNLSPHLEEKIKNRQQIRYVHYVDDVNGLYQASTLFLNPVINDSGVKTKLVEALANGCKVISTHSGATGIPPLVCDQNLVTTKDGDWPAFVAAILANLGPKAADISPAFIPYFSWPYIAKKAAGYIQDVVSHA